MYSSRLLGRSAPRSRRSLYPAFPVILSASFVEGRNSPTRKNVARLEEDPSKRNKKDASKTESPVFDITQRWKTEANNARDFWKSAIFTGTEEKASSKDQHTPDPLEPPPHDPTEPPPQDPTEPPSTEQMSKPPQGTSLESLFGKVQEFMGVAAAARERNNKGSSFVGSDRSINNDTSAPPPPTSFKDMAASFTAILAGGGTEASIQKMVRQARESAEEGDVADKKSLEEVLGVLKEYAEALSKTAQKYLGDVDLSNVYPTNLFYYIEHQDQVKNPSWKRRMHRFYPGIDISRMDGLNDDLQLAELSYADTVQEIQEGLEHNKTPFELVMADTNSYPNRPAHFIAVKRPQPMWSPYLEVIMCVRGTKTIDDALTDLLCDDVDYRGGKAHSGVLEGGKYLANKHKPLLLNLLKTSGKPKMKLRLIGHSLGAGAASIIGMELNDEDNIEVDVIGFGCPALLSKELSESTKGYITTVVADNDCVPRLSAASVVNALLDIMEYDYRPSARRDVKHAIAELQRMYPMIITKGMSNNILEFVDPLMEEMLGSSIKATSQKRMEPILFPPGTIIHFYRDGVGVTGSVCPCEFFGELDINRRLVDDHLFWTGYQQIFLELMRQHHQDHYFKFDEEIIKK